MAVRAYKPGFRLAHLAKEGKKKDETSYNSGAYGLDPTPSITQPDLTISVATEPTHHLPVAA